MNDVTFKQQPFTHLDYTDDLSLLAELLQLLVPVVEIFQKETAPLGLEVKWQKTMVKALGPSRDAPPSVSISRHRVQCVKKFIYLESLIHLTCSSEPEIRRRSAVT